MTENNRKYQNTSASERDYDETSNATLSNENESAYSLGSNYSDETDLQDAARRQRRNRPGDNYGGSSQESYNQGSRNYAGRSYGPAQNREWDDTNRNPDANFGIQGSSYAGRMNQGREYSGGQQWNSGYGTPQYGGRSIEDQYGGGRRYQNNDENNPQWQGRFGQSANWQPGAGRYPQYGNTNYGQRIPQYGNYGVPQYESGTYGPSASLYGNNVYEQGRNQYDNSNYGQSGQQYGNINYGQSSAQPGTNYGSGSQYSDANYGQGRPQYGNSYSQGGLQYETMHKGKGPKGYRRSDERIKEDINDRLTDDTHLDASDIEVAVTNGEVKLSGTVESREAKRRAEDLAEMISGISNVENTLRVKQDRSNKGTSAGSVSSSSSTLVDGHDNKNKRASAMS
jgi:hypothetical protein